MAKAIVIYETTYGYTETMAKAIVAGLEETGVDVELKRVLSAKAEDLKDFDAVVLGCPTYHHDMITTVKTFLFKMNDAGLKGKVGAAFGAYGFSGESIDMIYDTMKHIFEMDVIEPAFKQKTSEVITGEKECKEFGKKIAAKIT
ncbi:MAG TPA: FprA family A-type flavoprotein [Methanophagales archaeon]|nr:FprA family A-type flavoprotein [Methanophagales archaeon]